MFMNKDKRQKGAVNDHPPEGVPQPLMTYFMENPPPPINRSYPKYRPPDYQLAPPWRTGPFIPTNSPNFRPFHSSMDSDATNFYNSNSAQHHHFFPHHHHGKPTNPYGGIFNNKYQRMSDRTFRPSQHSHRRQTQDATANAPGNTHMDEEEENSRNFETSFPFINIDSGDEIFARKVFVGGLPIDVSEEEIRSTFSKFGPVFVDWPRRPDRFGGRGKSSGRSLTGYVFLVFALEKSVRKLVEECHKHDNKYFMFVSSPTMHFKPVQVRPWRLCDSDYMLREDMRLDSRRTVFIGGVPRPTRAVDLAEVLTKSFGPVSYVGIDIDPELKYPKGAARVTFITEKSYIAAMKGRVVNINHGDTKKQIEIKPYVMNDQICDECEGKNCYGRYAPYFCADVTCLQYFCEYCWDYFHYGEFANVDTITHKPFVVMGEETKLLPHPPHHANGLMYKAPQVEFAGPSNVSYMYGTSEPVYDGPHCSHHCPPYKHNHHKF